MMATKKKKVLINGESVKPGKKVKLYEHLSPEEIRELVKKARSTPEGEGPQER